MDHRSEQIELIFKLLRQTTTVGVVSNELKKRNLTYSANSWEALKDQRVLPAIDSGAITVNDLLELLRDAEEHGTQHVFLYACEKPYAGQLLDPKRLQPALMTSPSILDQPDTRTISDVRIEDDGSLVIKIVDCRTREQLDGQPRIEGDLKHFVMRIVRERVVHVARLSRDGVLELRIGSHRNNTGYSQEVAALRQSISGIIPTDFFGEFSIKKAKDSLWALAKSHDPSVRQGSAKLKNDGGFAITVATPSVSSNVCDDHGATSSMDAFLDDEDAWMDTSNIWWERNEETSIPSKKIHTRLAGDVNEFAITANCSRQDYEYVFTEIKRHNK